MSRISISTLIAFALATGTSFAQATHSGEDDRPETKNAIVERVTGCVSADDGNDQAFTLSDRRSTTYALTGADLKSYVGKRVQLKGRSSRRIHVVGGLWPSPNVAAQAGAIDPLQTTFATLAPPVKAPSTEPEFDFRIERIRTVSGRCP